MSRSVPSAERSSSTPLCLTPRQVLARSLSARRRRLVSIAHLVARRLAERSTHEIARWWITLDSGERESVIFKRIRPGSKHFGNEREVLIYRRLLRNGRFGAPRLLASHYDADTHQYWLFLEDLGRRTLHKAEFADWIAAVRCLAKMHGTYWGRTEELYALGCLSDHGTAYYQWFVHAARKNLEAVGNRQALARLDRLAKWLDRLGAWLARQPRTLIHGDLFIDNVMVWPGHHVRPVDWEEAAIGLGTWDLARLLDGWGEDRPALVDAYWAEFGRRAKIPMDRSRFEQVLRRCDALTALLYLAWEEEDCRDTQFVNDNLERLEAFRNRRWRHHHV